MENEKNVAEKATRKQRLTMAELEKRLAALERRVAILEAKNPNVVATNFADEGGDEEQHLGEGVAEETMYVHDVAIS